MLWTGELYANQRFISKVTAYPEDDGQTLYLVPKNRQHFLLFHSHETITLHQMDGNGLFSLYHVTFDGIHMIRTKSYYRFRIESTETYERLKNPRLESGVLHALLQDSRQHFPVLIHASSDGHLIVETENPPSETYAEIFYYIGKKKICFLAEHEPGLSSGKKTCHFRIHQKTTR